MKKSLFGIVLGVIGIMGTLSMGVVNAQGIDRDIVLEATATEANQTLMISKYFANAYTVDRGDGTTGNLTADGQHTYDEAGTYTITLSLSGADRWTFKDVAKPLVPDDGTNMTGVKITYMPSLADAFGDSATSPGDYFFYDFNVGGAIESLPEGSFDTSNITTVGDYFFANFNAPYQYYYTFQGQLRSLPEGSFDTSNITTVGDYFFFNFNAKGVLTSLPENSFRFATGLTIVGDYFFAYFNYQGALTSLPEGSFKTENITTAGDNFFAYFNYHGALTSLPERSFDTSNITSVGVDFFSWFNFAGKLINLPEGSFRFSTGLTTVGGGFFADFNRGGKLTTLPEGSFDTSNITTVLGSFFENFNRNGHITKLPDSFTMNSAGASGSNGYKNAFNSTGYTLNRKVSDLVSGVTVPLNDRDTFSDNQPGRCGAAYYWLQSGEGACSIVYDANGGTGTTTGFYFWGYYPPSPIPIYITVSREGYSFSGWYNVSGEKVENVIFPDMDGETLYAYRDECEEGYVTDYSGTSCVLGEYNITYNLGGGYLEDEEGNKYEGNQVVTYTYNSTGNNYVANLERDSVKRENGKFLGWYTINGDVFDFGTIPPENGTAYAKFVCNVGYVENVEKTACEKIRVEFDANGGKFSNNSGLYNIFADIFQIETPKQITLHTKNLTDEGNYSTGTSPSGCTKANGGNNVEIYESSTGYIHVEGANELNVSIRYGGGSYGSQIGALGVRAGQNTTGQPTWYISSFPVYGTISTAEFTIQGDSIFISQNSGYPNYGWYVTVTKDGVYEVVYGSGAFDNIPELSREGHKFVGWYLADGIEFNTGSVSTGEVTKVYAKWECADGYENKGGECVKKSSGSSGGGGGGGGGSGGGSSSSSSSGSTSTGSDTSNQPIGSGVNDSTGSGNNSSTGTQNDQTTTGTNIKEPEGTGNNAEIQTGSQIDTSENNDNSDTPNNTEGQNNSQGNSTYSDEFKQAYEFAKGKGITTMPTIQKADMNGNLTRIAMAKMLSQYAMNVLGQKPADIVVPKFNDVTEKMDSDYDDGVTLAYQLGIMGQNMPNNRFRPNDEVTRAEFATALSRMIYGTSDGEYRGTGKYYIHHMEKLVEEGIITKDDPKMKELRGYVMIMLMRSSK